MSKQTWITEGFEAFRAGEFGNGGQNIYVSRKGILQRIFQYDLNHNGYIDLVFANCQNHHESAESYVYASDGNQRFDLPGQGSVSGLADDLNDTGYQDIVIAGRYDMAAPYATSEIYFGSASGYSENNHIKLPTPWSENVTSGRFKPGAKSLVFAMPIYKQIRIFDQNNGGFEWSNFIDWDVPANQVAAIDLDGDGFDELVTVSNDLTFGRVYWGDENGLDPENYTELPQLTPDDIQLFKYADNLKSQMEKDVHVAPQLRTGKLNGRSVISWATGKKVVFFAADSNRKLERIGEQPAAGAIACTIKNDLVAIAARPESFIFKNGECVAKIATPQASDAAVGKDDLVYFSNNGGDKTYTCECLQLTEDGTVLRKFEGEDTRRIIPLDNPDFSGVLLVNRYSRSSIGFDRSYIYWGSKDGYSKDNKLEVPSWCAVDSLCADFDDDGWAELLIGNNSENSMYLNPGHHLHYFGPDGFIPEKTRTLPNELGWGVICGDVDHDGYLEIISSCDKWSNIRIYHGKTNFTTWEDIPVNAGNGLRWIGAYDLNNNGYLDLVLPYKNNPLILWGGPEGYSMERSQKLNCYYSLSTNAADLTGNGYLDLIIGGHTETVESDGYLKPRQPHHSYVYIYWGGPEGFSERRKCVLRGDAADSFAIADFNNDGFLDLFVGSYHGGKDRDINSFLYWNRNGSFSELDRDLLYTHSASGCLAADFNEDGFVDLAVANHKVDGDHHGWSAVWWNGPDGFNPANCTKLPTNGPHGMTSINPGNIKDRGPEEYYTSSIFTAEKAIAPVRAKAEMELPEKCWVKIRFRGAENANAMDAQTWSQWFDLAGGAELPEFTGAVCWQYQLALGSTNSLRTPRISKIIIDTRD